MFEKEEVSGAWRPKQTGVGRRDPVEVEGWPRNVHGRRKPRRGPRLKPVFDKTWWRALKFTSHALSGQGPTSLSQYSVQITTWPFTVYDPARKGLWLHGILSQQKELDFSTWVSFIQNVRANLSLEVQEVYQNRAFISALTDNVTVYVNISGQSP